MSETSLKGIHHVTAMTDDAERNYHFVTGILGMRLVKKTINQDDIQTYHTYYADDRGNPGTDLTFFDFPNAPIFVPGTNSISRTGLRVPDDAALEYYLDRFEEHDVKHEGIQELFGKKVLPYSYRMSDIDKRIFNKAKEELLEPKDNSKPIFDELSIEKIKTKKGNKIQRFVIRFKEYEDPNPVPMINFMTGEKI